MHQKIFIYQKFALILLIAIGHPLATDYSQYLYVAVAILVALWYWVDGWTVNIFEVGIAVTVQQIADNFLGETQWFRYVGSLIAAIFLFRPIVKVYDLPKPRIVPGFRKDRIEGKYDYYTWFPVKQSGQSHKKLIPWNEGRQLDKMMDYANIKNRAFQLVTRLVLSYIKNYQVPIAKQYCSQVKVKRGIAFSHGRGATPFMYTSLIYRLLANDQQFKISSIQHTDINRPHPKTKEQLKQFRERQVITRAKQFEHVIDGLGTQEIIFMGHSYGCATIIQAYHSLPVQKKRKVSHIILLDPWLFPLTVEMIESKFECPVLMLANQDFLKLEDIYLRDKKYVQIHNDIRYICWKDAHHNHPTDNGFIVGNTPTIIVNSHLSQKILNLHEEAIIMFLKGENPVGKFGDCQLPKNHQPHKFYPDGTLPY